MAVMKIPEEIEKITSYCRASAMKNMSEYEHDRHIWRKRHGTDLRCSRSFTMDENLSVLISIPGIQQNCWKLQRKLPIEEIEDARKQDTKIFCRTNS